MRKGRETSSRSRTKRVWPPDRRGALRPRSLAAGAGRGRGRWRRSSPASPPFGSISAETPEFTARTMLSRSSTVANTASARCSQGSVRLPYQESTVRLTSRFGCAAPDLHQIVGQDVLVADDRARDPRTIPPRSLQSSTRGPVPAVKRELPSGTMCLQPGKDVDPGNVFAEGQQPHLVVAAGHRARAVEQDRGVVDIVVRRIVRVGADDHRTRRGRDGSSRPSRAGNRW